MHDVTKLSDTTTDGIRTTSFATCAKDFIRQQSLIKERILKAAQYIPLERLCLSPQCGFASCEIGNKLTEEEQWAKLRLVQEVASEVWG